MDECIAIIGAGPAGSMLAYKLASSGKKVILYDHQAPWEKPCGGMLRPTVITEHKEMQSYPYPLSLCDGIVYISTRNDRKQVPAEIMIPVISRIELNRYLLDLAKGSNAEFIGERVLSISQRPSRWVIKTDGHTHHAALVIGADGVNSIVRKATIGEFPQEHLSLTCGYLLTGVPENQYIMKFLDIEGYIWIFSRANHTSAGIGAKFGTVSGKKLFGKLNCFLNENFPGWEIVKKYSALIPSATHASFFDNPCCGENWMLVGDAAGHVDPVVGEGIYYALESSKLAAEAILGGDIQSYDMLWRDRYGSTLKQRAVFRQSLPILSQGFDPEIIGALMYNQALGNFFPENLSPQ